MGQGGIDLSDLKQTTEDSRPVVLLAAVAAALIGAFVYYRTDDLLKLPSLIGNLGGTPFIGSGIIDSLAGAIIAFLLLAAWFGLGSVVMRLVQLKRAERHSHVLEAVITTAAGAAAWSLVWFLLGVAGLYSPAAAIVSLAAGIACAIYGSRRLREARRERGPGAAVSIRPRDHRHHRCARGPGICGKPGTADRKGYASLSFRTA